MKKKKNKIGSIIVGAGLGVLLAIWLSYIIVNHNLMYIFIPLFAIGFGLLGYYKSGFTEIAAYAVSIYIFLQVAWDYSVLDRSDLRLNLFLSALVLLIINLFAGQFKLNKPIKIFKKTLGMN